MMGEGTLRPAQRPILTARREDGFTLVEVLVSLVLLALVLAVLAGGLRFARGTWGAADKLDELAGYAMAERFLRARLGEAMPVYEHSAAGTVRVAFQGSGDTLSFVAPASNGPAGAGLYRYVLEAAPAQVLAVRLAPYQPKQGRGEADLSRHELLRGVQSVAFRYFGPSQLGGAPAWHAAWTRTDALPNLVEISIARDDREGGSLSLIVELRLLTRAQ